MAAFSYQDLHLLVDYVLTPDMMMKLASSSSSSSVASPSLSPSCCFSEDQTNLLNCNSNSYYSKPIFCGEQLQSHYPIGDLGNFHQDQLNPMDCSVHESSCVDQDTVMALAHSTPACSDNEPSVTAKQSTQSGGGGGGGKQEAQNLSPLHNKRKPKGHGSSPNSANSKDVKGGRSKKQKKCNNETVKQEKEEDEDRNKINEQNKDPHVVQEPPKGYIHVRARRGQATDSHSLAERVRREKISERMKLLQALVPGCNKVTGKATMLDEIINYVQSLQSQVEFLSMKLASLSPMFYNFGVDLEALLLQQQGLNNMTPPLASMQECSPSTTINTQPTNLATTTTATGFPGTINYPVVEAEAPAPAPPLFQQQQVGQRGEPNPPCLQDNIGSLYWEVGDQGGAVPTNQPGFCNNMMYSF